MADVLFAPSWSGSLSLKGTAQTDIPCLSGSGLNRSSGVIAPVLAQGSAGNAFSVNRVPLRKTSALGVQTYGFSTLINSTFLNAAYFTRSAAGDIGSFGAKFQQSTGDIENDDVKAAGLHIDCAADGPVNLGMGFLGLGKTTTVSTFVAYAATAGLPYYFKDVNVRFQAWTTSFATIADATLAHSFSLDVSTGAHYAAWFDGNDYASQIDPGILGGTFTIAQRPGATVPVANSTSGKFTITFATSACTIAVQAFCVYVGNPIDVNGAAITPSSCVITSLDGASPVVVS